MDPSTYYATRYAPDPRRDAVWREIARYLQRYVPETASVLELGAGYCPFINNIKAARRAALDLNDAVRQHAAPGVETHVGSCTALDGFPENGFDLVFASNLFEHISKDDFSTALGGIRRILKKTPSPGTLMILQPNFRHAWREYFDDYTHETVWTDRSLPDFLAAHGFLVTEVRPRFVPFSMNSGLPVHPLLVRLYLRSPWKPRAGQMLVLAQPAA